VVEVAATVDEMILLQAQNSVGLSATTGDQMLTGNGSGNVIWGGGGNDVLSGMGGNDVLHGDESNQTATAALDLTAIVPDPNDVQGFWVTVSGLPAGATLSIGFDLGNGQWRVGGLELTNLKVSWPASAGNLNLTAVATGFDIDPDTGNIATKDGPPATAVITASDAYGNDVLTGGAGNDTLISNGGTDSLSGGANNDTYIIGNNDGATINATIHNDATNDATETDTLKLFSSLSPEDIWFQKQGADLIVKLLDGSNGTITIADWYTSDSAKLDTITITGGEHLDRSKVDQLVQEMANYGAPPSPDAPMPPAVQTAIDDAWEP
jgi:Ca2+-binding RTX toxin-like protein